MEAHKGVYFTYTLISRSPDRQNKPENSGANELIDGKWK
jgi:hypothetical protein